MLIDFNNWPDCGTRAHCSDCRTNPVWKATTGAPDICPWGVTADDLPPVRDISKEISNRLAFCIPCDNDECGIKHATDCRRRAILSRENFHCPDGQF